MEATVKIEMIIMFCDESVLGIQFGNGYTAVKTYLSDFSNQDRIVDGRGQLDISYLHSAKKDENGKFFFCLKKETAYQMRPPKSLVPGGYTNEQIRCDDQVSEFGDSENQYLHKIFSLLHIFKAGNIGTKQVFFEHNFSYGLINNTVRRTSDNVTRNIVDERVFSLTPAELVNCNRFLLDYSGAEYTLMKHNIDEFIQGLAAVNHSVGFEQFTTALEMTLLARGQKRKKEVLSKRIAVLLEDSSADITRQYMKMKDFYRYRSESLHEGDDHNITEGERLELEDVVRRVLAKCLQRCKAELTINPSITWNEIKEKIINELKTKVTAEEAKGTFDC